VWNRTGLWGSVQHALSNTSLATNVIFSLLEHLSSELSQRLSTVIWSIWKHRNLRVWDDVTETNATVVERARNMVADWQLANTPDVLASASVHQTSTDNDMEASYINAAFSAQLNRTSIGICVRDSEGTFVLDKNFTYPCNV
jgi:hypothetical protein